MKKKNGISLVMYLKYIDGLGQVGRDFFSKISLTNFQFDLFDLSLKDMTKDRSFDKFTSNYSNYKKRLIFDTCQKKLVGNYYNIKTLFWEFESGMLDFRPETFKKLDEVVAFTDFIYDYVSKIAPKNVKVTKMKYPFIKNWNIENCDKVRTRYGIKKDDFVCFFNFDYRSCYKRKNPEGVVKAFKETIGGFDNAKLIIKTSGFKEYGDEVIKLEKYVKDLNIEEKVIFINEYLSRNESLSLINASNCYISLHRGEGLGLGMLEAMALSKPVIATNYSGNTEYTKADNSLLVDYEMVYVKKEDVEDGPYFGVKKWAEPNIETAKNHLLKLYNDPEFAYEIGLKASEFVENYFSLDEFKSDIEKIFDIKEHSKKAPCLFQKRKKLYFISFLKEFVKRKILKRKVCEHII